MRSYQPVIVPCALHADTAHSSGMRIQEIFDMPPPDAAEKSAVPTIDPDDPIFQRIVELAGLPDNYFG